MIASFQLQQLLSQVEALLRAGNLPEGMMIFYVVPVAVSLTTYFWLGIGATDRIWRAAQIFGILLAPLASVAVVILFLYTLCNIAIFGVCEFP